MGKMNKNLISLKPYLESVKEQCSCLSNEGLTEIILGLAKEIPAKTEGGILADDRQAFSRAATCGLG